jgi:hypothetical protein
MIQNTGTGEERPKSSAVIAGWICIGLGYLTFWIFGLGFLFFSVTMILSVVSMCTNRVRDGVLLLISALVSLVICGIIFVLLVLGSIGAAAKKVSDDIKKGQRPITSSEVVK